jgi:hypothetical protein
MSGGRVHSARGITLPPGGHCLLVCCGCMHAPDEKLAPAQKFASSATIPPSASTIQERALPSGVCTSAGGVHADAAHSYLQQRANCVESLILRPKSDVSLCDDVGGRVHSARRIALPPGGHCLLVAYAAAAWTLPVKGLLPLGSLPRGRPRQLRLCDHLAQHLFGSLSPTLTCSTMGATSTPRGLLSCASLSVVRLLIFSKAYVSS